jgi:hypothetical protein
MDMSEHAWGKEILRDLVARARQAGVPTLIHIVPLNLSAIDGDEVARGNFAAFEEWFQTFAATVSYGNVHIIPQTPTRTLAGLKFYDISHLTEAAPYVRFMNDEISRYALAER